MKFSRTDIIERSVKLSRHKVSEERIAEGCNERKIVSDALDDRVPDKIKNFIKQFESQASMFGYSFDKNTNQHKAYIILGNTIHKIICEKENIIYQKYIQDKKLIKLYNTGSNFNKEGIPIKKYLNVSGTIKQNLPRLLNLIDKNQYMGAEWLKKNQDMHLTYIAFSKNDITIYYISSKDKLQILKRL